MKSVSIQQAENGYVIHVFTPRKGDSAIAGETKTIICQAHELADFVCDAFGIPKAKN